MAGRRRVGEKGLATGARDDVLEDAQPPRPRPRGAPGTWRASRRLIHSSSRRSVPAPQRPFAAVQARMRPRLSPVACRPSPIACARWCLGESHAEPSPRGASWRQQANCKGPRFTARHRHAVQIMLHRPKKLSFEEIAKSTCKQPQPGYPNQTPARPARTLFRDRCCHNCPMLPHLFAREQ